MRIWSLHPQYLDSKGLVALWRETLLARHVLLGLTKGYQNHPQLSRFRAMPSPVSWIDAYLQAVYHEACERGYHFNASKFEHLGDYPPENKMVVTQGQVAYEWQHLQNKLAIRDEPRWILQQEIPLPMVHPVFKVEAGGIADWEVVHP